MTLRDEALRRKELVSEAFDKGDITADTYITQTNNIDFFLKRYTNDELDKEYIENTDEQ